MLEIVRDESVLQGIRFAGQAHVLPSKPVTNAEVLAAVRAQSARHMSSVELDNVIAATEAAFLSAGTTVRYHRTADERAFELCTAAARQALDRAGMGPEDIDLVIYVGVGRGFLEPATANVFQDLLGLRNATCFDILDACASWIRALEVARSFILGRSGYRAVLILNAEFLGREAHRYELRSPGEFQHWFPGVTIGEAATATVVTGVNVDDDFRASFKSWGEKRNLCLLPLPNAAEYLGTSAYQESEISPLEFVSFGGPLLAFGATKLISHYKSLPPPQRDADRIFGHAASDGMCRHVGEKCGIDLERFRFTHHLFGNTVSASVPLAMSLSQADGSLKSGDNVLILVASAGVSTGVVRFRYCN